MDETKERNAFINWALGEQEDITTAWGDDFAANQYTRTLWRGWKARAAYAAAQGSTLLARSSAGLPVAEETVRKALQEADDGK